MVRSEQGQAVRVQWRVSALQPVHGADADARAFRFIITCDTFAERHRSTFRANDYNRAAM